MGGFLKGLWKWYSYASIASIVVNGLLAPVFGLPTVAVGVLGQNAFNFVGSAFTNGIPAVFCMAIDVVKACLNGITGALGMTSAGAHPIIRAIGDFLATETPLTFGGEHVVKIAQSTGDLFAASFQNIVAGASNTWSILSGHALPGIDHSFKEVAKQAVLSDSSNITALNSKAIEIAGQNLMSRGIA
jgi:hypothetical protein